MFLLLLASCGLHEPGPASSAPAERDVSAEAQPFDGTVGVVDVPRIEAEVATLADVRVGRHELFDRVVFELDGPVPGYHVEYVDRPVRECGSGNVREMPGDAWLEVRLEPARAHTEEGEATIGDRRRPLELPNLRQLDLTCDFEAQVVWVLGLDSPMPYRVIELSDPPRLVIDVHHP